MKQTLQLVMAMIVCSSLYIVTSSSTSATPSLQAGRQPHMPPGPHPELLLSTSKDSKPAFFAAPSPSAIPGWSRLVFQSFRDNNWEIYSANADGSGQTRVTDAPSVDYAPRLDPGADRIAFASDRNGGDYDIFVVDWNGAGLTALTDNSSDDVAPAWSPNGNKLAFEAYRDGQAEVYVMNATGSAVTRLTNNSAYDGTPAWSPDGSKIAFTSKRTGSYQVWLMNADGTEPIALTNYPNAYDPAWSPDGSQIAFDADADGDGYEELWVMNADGSGSRQVYDPPLSNQVAWARSWSADGRYVAFSQLTWDGPITTDATIEAWDSLIPGSIVPLSPGNRDTNPDWQATPDPDLWVSQSSSAALPGEQVDLELIYGNRGTVAARDVRITEELPAGLTFVSADPPPNATSPVLRWNKSTLPPSSSQSLIRITVRVDPATPPGTILTINAGIASDTSEPDLDNNTATGTLTIGQTQRRSYLPLVTK